MTIWRYVSVNGEYILGVPARDLTQNEFRGLTLHQQRAVQQIGIYREGNAPRPRRTRKELLSEVNDDAN